MRFVKAVRIGSLKPLARNPRAHTDLDLDALVRSIGKFGWTNPVLVQENTNRIIAGAGRLEAAKRLGLKTVPAVYLDLDKTEAAAYSIADNQLATLSSWDDFNLKEMLHELGNEKFDLSTLGFSDRELRDLIDPDPADDADDLADEVPPIPKKPLTKTGDLWILGDHRLLCADCTVPEQVAHVMNGAKALVMATDPPYGVAYDNAERPNPGVAKPRVAKPRVANDEIVDGAAMQAFLESMLRAALPRMDKHAAFYFWHPMLTQGTYVAAAAAAAGILIHRQIIWVKPGLLLGRGDYHWRHELCFYGWQQGNRPPFYGPRNQDTVWEMGSVSNNERKDMNHPTPKPTALWDKPIRNHTKEGGILFEPFAGSGPQIIAAEIRARKCYALEIDPKYCDVIVERWQDLTGKKAQRKPATVSHE